MKTIRFILAGVIVFLIAGVMNAQENNRNNELSASYGIISLPEIEDIFIDVTSGILGGADSIVTDKSFGNIYLNYQHGLSEKFFLGLTFGYYQARDNSYKKGVKIGEQMNQYYTFAIEAKFKYIDHEKFQMYSGAGLGLSVNPSSFESNDGSTTDNDTFTSFTFQLIGAGVRYGKAFGVFAEAGFGYKGVLNAGVSYQF